MAIKILKPDLTDLLKEMVSKEVETMKDLDHPNILRPISFNQERIYRKPSGDKTVDYIVTELAKGGELCDYLIHTGGFTEPVARFYFKQALEALDYCHSHKIAHRDMKPENLLLDDDFNLMICDFGFAANLNE